MMRRQLNRLYKNKLTSYSLVAGTIAGIGIGNKVEGAVVYTDIPDVVIGTVDYNIDMDGAGPSVDFSVGISAGTDFIFLAGAGFQSASGVYNSFFGFTSSPSDYAMAFSFGEAIGSGSVYSSAFVASTTSSSNFFGGDAGWIGRPSDKYVGVIFNISGNVHYGWIHVDLSIPDPEHATVTGFAYDDTPNAIILAGDEGLPTGVVKRKELDASIYSYDQNISVQLSKTLKGKIEVYNTAGQLVFNESFTDSKRLVSVKGNGMHLVKVTSGGRTTSRKVYLN